MPPGAPKKRPSKKGEKSEVAKRGRPPKPFDTALLDELVQLQCTLKEVSAAMRMHEETIEIKMREHFGCSFYEYFRRHRGLGLVSLRRAQLKSAIKGNTSMQQWLGRQWLGQTEHGSPVHPADQGEEILKAAPPKWEVIIKNVPGGITPQQLAELMASQLDPVKPADTDTTPDPATEP